MTWLSLKLIRFYQVVLSLDQGWLGKIVPHGDICRFQPTCSEYTYQAIAKYGFFKGGWLGAKRIARCHPWGPFGPDPVP